MKLNEQTSVLVPVDQTLVSITHGVNTRTYV